MLTEDDVIEAVCKHLGERDCVVVSRCSTTERGQDVVARLNNGTVLRIEAKGETSNRKSSRRFGKPFTSAQCRDHVANAFFSAAEMLGATPTEERELIAVAFADTAHHRKYVGRIQRALEALSIGVFWVRRDLSVAVRGGKEYSHLGSML